MRVRPWAARSAERAVMCFFLRVTRRRLPRFAHRKRTAATGRPNALMTGSGPYTQGLQLIRSWLSVCTSGKVLSRKAITSNWPRTATPTLQR